MRCASMEEIIEDKKRNLENKYKDWIRNINNRSEVSTTPVNYYINSITETHNPFDAVGKESRGND